MVPLGSVRPDNGNWPAAFHAMADVYPPGQPVESLAARHSLASLAAEGVEAHVAAEGDRADRTAEQQPAVVGVGRAGSDGGEPDGERGGRHDDGQEATSDRSAAHARKR